MGDPLRRFLQRSLPAGAVGGPHARSGLLTRVGVIAEPLRLCLAIEGALKREPDLEVVRLRMGDGAGGRGAGADVVLVTVPLPPAGRAPATARSGRTPASLGADEAPGIVLLEVPAGAARAFEGPAGGPDEIHRLEFARSCRRRVVAAIREARARRADPGAPLVELRLDPPAPAAMGSVTSIDRGARPPRVPRVSTPLVRTG